MYKLEFMNPIGLTNEVFSTARLGIKWAERSAPKGEDGFLKVELVDTNGNSFGTATVVGCWTGPLSQAPALLLECSHDPVCRTWSGLAQVMAGVYEGEEVSYETIISVLQLRYTGKAIQVVSADTLEKLR